VVKVDDLISMTLLSNTRIIRIIICPHAKPCVRLSDDNDCKLNITPYLTEHNIIISIKY